MPIYEYRCCSCGYQFEKLMRMSDPPHKTCEACGESVEQLFSPVALHFKGSGFYSTDYKKGGAPKEEAPTKDAKEGTSKEEPKAPAKEGAAKTEAPTLKDTHSSSKPPAPVPARDK